MRWDWKERERGRSRSVASLSWWPLSTRREVLTRSTGNGHRHLLRCRGFNVSPAFRAMPRTPPHRRAHPADARQTRAVPSRNRSTAAPRTAWRSRCNSPGCWDAASTNAGRMRKTGTRCALVSLALFIASLPRPAAITSARLLSNACGPLGLFLRPGQRTPPVLVTTCLSWFH